MIPKIIHYSWVGTTIPRNVVDRINEWKSKLPDYKFMYWNEENYDFSKFKFTREKMKNHQWGYVTDELRYDVLYNYGGFYMDTDMIIKKNISDLLNQKMVWGFQYDNAILTAFVGSEPHHHLLKEILAQYSDEGNFGSLNRMVSNPFVTNIFIKKYGDTFTLNNKLQELEDGLVVYPRDYFCYPSHNDNANYAEHLFDNTWNNGKKQKGVYGFAKKIFKDVAPCFYADVANKRGVKATASLLIR